MKNTFAVIGIFLVGVCQAQVLWSDGFETYSPGALGSQGGYTSFFTDVFAGGGALPLAYEGSNMIGWRQGASPGSAYVVSDVWQTRDPGNNTLVLRGAVWLDEQNFGFGSLGLYGDSGYQIGGQSIQANSVFSRTETGMEAFEFFSGPAWHTLMISANFDTGQTAFFVDGTQRNALSFDPSKQPMYWGINVGTITSPNDRPPYFDSLKLEAVPEPLTLVGLGIAGLAVSRRKRKA